VLERAPDATVLVSHAGCRAIVGTPRNIDDEALRALAARGGLLGIMAHPFAVDPERPTLERLVDHVEHAVDVAGIDHVGLGGDFTRQIERAVGTPPAAAAALPPGVRLDDAVEGLEGPEQYGALVEALRRRGFEGEQLQQLLSDNLLRLLRRGLPPA
jgi:membrane dipeptidase